MKREEEIKEWNTDGTYTTVLADTWAAASQLNDIDIGNTSATRIGNKIVVKSIMWRGTYIPNAAETNVCSVRLVLVYDRKPNGALAVGGDIFNQDSSIGNLNSADPLFAGRFQILYDKTIPLGQGKTGGTRPVSRSLAPIFIKRDLKTMYNATGGGIADCQRGSLLMLACTTNSTHDGQIVWNAKLKYADS